MARLDCAQRRGSLARLLTVSAWAGGFVGVCAAAAESPANSEPTPVRAFRSFDRRAYRGLAQSTPNALLQDRDGVLWIGTMDGLSTFDGAELDTIPDPPGFPGFGAVQALAARRRGGIYVGGTAGIHTFDGTRWSFIATRRGVTSLAEDDKEAVWFVDLDGMLWYWPAPGGGAPRHAAVASSELGPAVAVVAPGDESVWVAFRLQVVRIRENRVTMIAPGSVPPSPITAVMVTRGGECWIGTKTGRVLAARSESSAWTTAYTAPGSAGFVRALMEDRRGRIWAGFSEGAVAFRGEHSAWTVWGPENGLKPSGIVSLLADREGTIWLGFNGAGLLQLCDDAWLHRTVWSPTSFYRDRLQVFGIRGTDDGGFLAAVFTKGIWRWDGHRVAQYGREAGLTEDVRCAVEVRPGHIVVGGRYGIFEARDGSRFHQTLRLDSGLVTGIFRSPNGAWYAASSRDGIYVLWGSAWEPASDLNSRLQDQNVRGMTWRRNGELWIATVRGLAVIRGDSSQWLTSQAIPQLPELCNCVLEVGEEEVWVGGTGGIAVRRGDVWKLLTPADGIPGHTVYSLARAPDGSIWAGASEGVGHFAGGLWSVYDSRNGLLEDECNLDGLWIGPGGAIYVGTMASLARFDPTLKPLPLPPLRCHWRATPPLGSDGAAHLSPSERTLRIAWAAPWLSPMPVEYRTRVFPWRPDWSEPQLDRELSVENLPRGWCEVQVSARIGDSTQGQGWSPPISLRVYAEPQWWDTAWARSALALMLAVAIYGVIRLRTRALQRRAVELQRGIDEAMAKVKILRGFLPICAHCKKVRDDAGAWRQIESYIRDNSEAIFSHGICPECMQKHYPEYVDKPDDPL
ncbi:MAG: two-component regulator propeller domain-containing protein [Acidobacteriota bacterium]